MIAYMTVNEEQPTQTWRRETKEQKCGTTEGCWHGQDMDQTYEQRQGFWENGNQK